MTRTPKSNGNNFSTNHVKNCSKPCIPFTAPVPTIARPTGIENQFLFSNQPSVSMWIELAARFWPSAKDMRTDIASTAPTKPNEKKLSPFAGCCPDIEEPGPLPTLGHSRL